jgi:hypothetical protein
MSLVLFIYAVVFTVFEYYIILHNTRNFLVDVTG